MIKIDYQPNDKSYYSWMRKEVGAFFADVMEIGGWSSGVGGVICGEKFVNSWEEFFRLEVCYSLMNIEVSNAVRL